MSVVLIDSERGARSVNHLVASGAVEVINANKFEDVENVVWQIIRNERKADGIIIDSITSLATTTRQDLIVDPAMMNNASLWQNRAKLTAAQRDWGNMSDLIGRLMRLLRDNTNVPIIAICHEGEREDLTTGMDKKGPDLNAALLKEVIHFSDAVLRLSLLGATIEVEGQRYAPGTRVLRLIGNEQCMAKVRIPGNMPQPPEILPDPTKARFLKVVGEMPHAVALYGPSGAGKTTLACELLVNKTNSTPIQKGRKETVNA